MGLAILYGVILIHVFQETDSSHTSLTVRHIR